MSFSSSSTRIRLSPTDGFVEFLWSVRRWTLKLCAKSGRTTREKNCTISRPIDEKWFKALFNLSFCHPTSIFYLSKRWYPTPTRVRVISSRGCPVRDHFITEFITFHVFTINSRTTQHLNYQRNNVHIEL